jgi:ribosomal protein L12E/L44/L45/RPP1/RPP2
MCVLVRLSGVSALAAAEQRRGAAAAGAAAADEEEEDEEDADCEADNEDVGYVLLGCCCSQLR